MIHRLPIDAADDWFDSQGVQHPRPATPANVNGVNVNSLLLEVQLNSSRVGVTSHRYIYLVVGTEHWTHSKADHTIVDIIKESLG